MGRSKETERKRGLFNFLLKNYVIAFSLTIAVMWSVSILIDRLAEDVFYDPFQGILHQNDLLMKEDFYNINTRVIVGIRGTIEILDSDGNMRLLRGDYLLMKEINDTMNFEEIPNIEEKYFTGNYREFQGNDGESRYLIEYYPFQNIEAPWYVLLDKNYNLIDSSKDIPIRKEVYTEEDIIRLTQYDKAVSEFYKYEFKSSMGNKFTMILRPKDYYPNRKELRKVFNNIRLILLWGILVLCTGGFTLVLILRLKKPIKDIEDGIEYYSRGVFKEIKQRKAPREIESIREAFNSMIRKVRDSQEKEKELLDEKRIMVADISHDFKTPITIINAYAKAIYDGKVQGEELYKYLGIMMNESERLTNLITLFHDYSKMEHPDYTPSLERICFNETMRKYLAGIYEYITDAGFELVIEIGDEKLYADIDKVAFQRAIWNLISNALKYNPQGTEIHVKVFDEYGWINLIVGDSGRGISEEIGKNIFKPFNVGDESRSEIHGTGLGLAITKKIIESHDGTIELDYSGKHGALSTVFEIKIPERWDI